MQEIELIESVRALNLESNELVVLQVPSVLTSEQRTGLRKSFAAACPNVRWMIIDGGVSVEALDVQPSDKIVVRCPGALSQDERDEWSTRLMAVFPENNCLVLEAGEAVAVASEWIVCQHPQRESCFVATLKGGRAIVLAECPSVDIATVVIEGMRAREEQKGE